MEPGIERAERAPMDQHDLNRWIVRARRSARDVGSAAVGLLVATWSVVRGPLVGALNVVLALILLFEEWGWKPLADLLGYLARLKPVARLELWIAGLPPYGALAVFALPTSILLPVKLLGLWLLANGQALLAAAMLIGAKIVSTALVARIFMLTKPALMQLAWFAWAYGKVIPWKDALFDRIRASFAWRYGRMVKTAVRQEARRAWARWKPQVTAVHAAIIARMRPVLATARRRLADGWRHLRARLGLSG